VERVLRPGRVRSHQVRMSELGRGGVRSGREHGVRFEDGELERPSLLVTPQFRIPKTTFSASATMAVLNRNDNSAWPSALRRIGRLVIGTSDT